MFIYTLQVEDSVFDIIAEDFIDNQVIFPDRMFILYTLQVEDSVFDIIAEDFIENKVIIPDLDEVIPEVATEVLSHYDTKVMRRELKEVVEILYDIIYE